MYIESTQISPRTPAEALAMMGPALDLLTGTDPHALDCEDLGRMLRALASVAARITAVQAAVLAAFEAVGGPRADGRATTAAWLAAHAGMSRAGARAAARWSRIQTAHPRIAEAMKAGTVTDSAGRQITCWTGKLPEHMRDGADVILLQSAAGGCGPKELEIVAARLWAEHKQSQPDEDEPEDTFSDRGLHLDITFGGAGRLRADLSPDCAAALQAVLEALGKHRGPEDTRTRAQRQHDALTEACQQLIAARTLPARAGSATRCETVIPFTALRDLPGAPAIEHTWLSGSGYLTGRDAEAASCDATLIPVVTGAPDWTATDKIIAQVKNAPAGSTRELRMEIARLAIGFCSGPAGIAAALRTALLGDVTGTVSLPLDVGYSEMIPEHIRRAVKARDKHCRWPGCDTPPARCECHHIVPKRLGGTTALTNCVLLCWFHHQICIHRDRWHFTLNPDGTTHVARPGTSPPAVLAA